MTLLCPITEQQRTSDEAEGGACLVQLTLPDQALRHDDPQCRHCAVVLRRQRRLPRGVPCCRPAPRQRPPERCRRRCVRAVMIAVLQLQLRGGYPGRAALHCRQVPPLKHLSGTPQTVAKPWHTPSHQATGH